MHAIIRRIHNPRGRTCGCASDCWCQRSLLGRAVRWWFPGRFVGIHHRRPAPEAWERDDPDAATAEWKRRHDDV